MHPPPSAHVPPCKELVWIGRAQRDFDELPPRVREELLLDLREAQRGQHPDAAKPLKGFGGASVLELVNNSQSGTYRVVYAVRF